MTATDIIFLPWFCALMAGRNGHTEVVPVRRKAWGQPLPHGWESLVTGLPVPTTSRVKPKGRHKLQNGMKCQMVASEQTERQFSK